MALHTPDWPCPSTVAFCPENRRPPSLMGPGTSRVWFHNYLPQGCGEWQCWCIVLEILSCWYCYYHHFASILYGQCLATPSEWPYNRSDLFHSHISLSHRKPQGAKWFRPPLQRYRQLWPQLSLVESIVCCCYARRPTNDQVAVPIIPPSLQKKVHDFLSAGHLGAVKKLGQACQVGYWVNMITDVEGHCRECLACQAAKPTLPQRVPLIIVSIGSHGRWWQLILEVPWSPKNNHYQLVVCCIWACPDRGTWMLCFRANAAVTHANVMKDIRHAEVQM